MEATPARMRTAWIRVAQWIALGLLVGLACGLASAVFLMLLDLATRTRTAHPSLVYALPLAGLGLGAVQSRWGRAIAGGNNLVLDTVHEDGPRIPLRMAPMVLAGTVLTHLFGGSAGREGTAVQMGASLADAIVHRVKGRDGLRRQILAAGMAGGFGSVFGTPIAGAVFGLEVLSIGRLEYDALLPALVASVTGDLVTRSLGVHHTPYPVLAPLPLDAPVLLKWLVFGLAIALVAVAFVELTHRLKALLARRIPHLVVRMAVGGLAVVALWRLVGSDAYLGLGVPTILRAFRDPAMPSYAFALKLVFTSVTLAAGFLGGEVTPLFFVGATLGAVLARLLGLPMALGAGVGLASLFGAAANTPIALSLMAVELMGASVLPHVVIVTVVAYLASGHRGIYPSQRLVRSKWGGRVHTPVQALRDLDASGGNISGTASGRKTSSL